MTTIVMFERPYYQTDALSDSERPHADSGDVSARDEFE
jgi:hypothetical protein